MPATYRGRFAPSPTGPLHFGSLVAAVASWLDARASGGQWLVRIEDVDGPRCVPGATEAILGALEAFGLAWDGEIEWQSRGNARYEAALERLRAAGALYRCRCSRKEIADSGAPGIEGSVYPGTCRGLGLGAQSPGADRVVCPAGEIAFEDRVQGLVRQAVGLDVGDFILRRRDGLFAYQLAVVVDDAWQGVTDIVRGADLLASTPRQIHLQRLLGYPEPRYLHVPVATHRGGQKMSKQSLAPGIDPASAAASLSAALAFLGQPVPEPASPASMLAWAAGRWDPGRIPRREALEAADGSGAAGTLRV